MQLALLEGEVMGTKKPDLDKNPGDPEDEEEELEWEGSKKRGKASFLPPTPKFPPEPPHPPVKLFAQPPVSPPAPETVTPTPSPTPIATLPKKIPAAMPSTVPTPTSSLLPSFKLPVLTVPGTYKALIEHLESNSDQFDRYSEYGMEKTVDPRGKPICNLNISFPIPRTTAVEIVENGAATTCTFTDKERLDVAVSVMLDAFIKTGQTEITISGSNPEMVQALATQVSMKSSQLTIHVAEDAKKVLPAALVRMLETPQASRPRYP